MSSRSRRRNKEERPTPGGERPRPRAGAPRPSDPSFGEELRRERELRGISLREVAESTKISLRYLSALEQNRFDSLPGGVFTKGFVKAYAQFIGLDPEGTVNAYLLERRTQAGDAQEEEAGDGRVLLRELARESRTVGSRPGARRRGLIWGVIATVIVILATVVTIVLLRPATDADLPAAEPAADSVPPPTRAEEIAEDESTFEDEAALEDAVAPERVTAALGVTPDEKDEAPAPEGEAPTEPPSRPTPSAPGEIHARVVLDRSTSGRLNCDNQRVEVLDGLPAGTVLELHCRKYLVLDASDGGGLRVGIGGASPAPLVADGVPLNGYRILPRVESDGGGGASS